MSTTCYSRLYTSNLRSSCIIDNRKKYTSFLRPIAFCIFTFSFFLSYYFFSLLFPPSNVKRGPILVSDNDRTCEKLASNIINDGHLTEPKFESLFLEKFLLPRKCLSRNLFVSNVLSFVIKFKIYIINSDYFEIFIWVVTETPS